MPVRAMTKEEVERFLLEQRVVRVCANVLDQLYLIPLGYVWIEGNLHGATISKRMREMVQHNPRVAFQIDDYAHATGPWAYRSITGYGDFECLGNPNEIERIAPVIRARFNDAPVWFQQEQAALAEVARVRFWRLHPVEMTGRMHAPGEQP
jgi:nitroimidazol reductase NimA-like FMN-containing flavoprotein (pyridoxamine 5'-phosphate oxidase superfamily)